MSSFFGNIGRNFGRSANRSKNNKGGPGGSHSPNSSGGSAGGGYYAPQQGGEVQGQPRARPLFLCQPFVKATVVKGSFKTIVVLPKYVDQGEWLALNMFEFFDYLRIFNGVVQEFCTHKTCPTMSAGPNHEFNWLDNNNNMKPVRMPAPDYIERVFSWISSKLADESLFPTKAVMLTSMPNSHLSSSTNSSGNPNASSGNSGNPPANTWIGKDNGFPPYFYEKVQGMYKQMFRVFAHIYHTHFDKIVHLSLEAHWNSFFQHFVYFGREFGLLDDKCLMPLRELVDAFDAQRAAMGTS